MRFVDANVFIYVLTKSPRQSFRTSQGILTRIEKGEEAITSTAVIQEVVDWLEYGGRRSEIGKFLTAINSYSTMHKSVPSWADMLSCLEHMDAHDLDYVDALTVQMMKGANLREIYSNDKDFDRVEWIRRIWK